MGSFIGERWKKQKMRAATFYLPTHKGVGNFEAEKCVGLVGKRGGVRLVSSGSFS
jgi:hypothetical protein